MNVLRLQLQDFRNYPRLDAEFDPGVNLIVGDNAQGKTNLLESLTCLSQGGSYRTRKEEELIRWEQDYARIEAEIGTAAREISLVYVMYRGPRRRQMLVNGVRQKRSPDGEDRFYTVLFCPEDLQILRAGAAVRRKFLDSAISPLRPQYRRAVSVYQKLYESKSRILRDRFLKPGIADLLPDYNRQMAEVGAEIIAYRAQYLKKLGQYAENYHGVCSGGSETLRIRYQTVSTVDDVFSGRRAIFEKLMEHQEAHYRAELESGRCLTGPHRDDFDVLLNGRSLRSFGSQGQTRTAAIALKLSEREIARDDTGETPVLLLDDVLSELDRGRQDFILNEIRSGQVFITCCETDKGTAAGRTFSVRGGVLRER